MIDFDQYTTTVLSAYAASIAVLAVLIWATVARNSRARRALEQQEKRGRDAR